MKKTKQEISTETNGEWPEHILTAEQETAIDNWISENLTRRKSFNYQYTSYGMKHMVEGKLGFYVSNDDFKVAMIRCGYMPNDAQALDPFYKMYIRQQVFRSRSRKRSKW